MPSAENPDEALSDVLATLAASARRSNLGRSDVIAAALGALGEGRLTQEQRAVAEQAAHQVVGSAGTFGARRASELAAALESYLAGDEASRAAGLARAREQLEELRAELRGHQVEE